MAPELYEGKYDTSVDIYAFGMCILEMVTGETPYRECANPWMIYKKVIDSQPPKALLKLEDERVKDFINWCLEVPSKRPTAAQLLESEFLNEDAPEDGFPVKVKKEAPKVRKHPR